MVGEDLGRIRIPSWTGGASGAFWTVFSREPPKWLVIGDQTAVVSDGLVDFGGALRWAQARAAVAIEVWEKGEAATRSAVATHNAAVAQHVPVAPFVDPGMQLREEAQELLTQARRQLAEVGDEVSRKIKGGPGLDAPVGLIPDGALDRVVDAVTHGWTATGDAKADGPDAGWKGSFLEDRKLGELKAYAYLASASAEGSLQRGLLELEGKAEAFVGAETTLMAGISGEDFNLRADLIAEGTAGAKATAQGRAEFGVLGYHGKGEAFAGASANARASIGMDGLSAGAGAFAGARAQLRACDELS